MKTIPAARLTRTLSTLAVLCTLVAAGPGCSSAPDTTPTPVPVQPTPSLDSIAVSAAEGTLAKGLSRQMAAVGTYSDGSSKDISGEVLWSSGDSSVAAVSSAGLAKGAGVGTVIISAALSGRTGSAELHIGDAELVALALAGQDGLPKGLTRQLAVSATYTDATVQDVSASVIWSSSDESLATVSNAAGTRGLVTAVSQGTVEISGSFAGKTTVAELAVIDPSLLSIAVTATAGSLSVGATDQLVATGTFSDGTTLDVSALVSWLSSDEAIATVSNDGDTMGLATGMGAGTTTIRAEMAGVAGTVDLTVL